ncbi:hypothetical protein FSU_2635 [Fibrobacter succinogenes subsp. succinogenes S85]|uniref:Uncharacterized protein n=1 Tax=Fibrobacter succinogenes (strain ATCC 19169 / S85) TaxID=59374 RepID=C9RJH6_FIBSS|nr:hypothetical protein [Fibrobacter succinogenes]ACX75693.1 hypothetical protein Fisuc_2106 [Fibrobacter succinogenes subsp. succinogenes S85]ADL25776.1 hypothetical protein FSU_2635 [Fibrobacter succinogenes subsp. succinogenes S85]
MQEQTSKFIKSKSETCCDFWQSLVKKIYAPNADVIFLHRRDVLAAFKRLQKAKPNYGFEISYKQESKGYRNCDKSQVVCLRKSLGSAASIEFLVDCDAKYLSIRFSHIDAGKFNVSYERCWCNLEATLENLVKFVDEFTNYNEQSSRIIMEIEKDYTIQMSFDIQNYLEQIPALQNVLKQTENFLKEIPFPISIKALDKSRF